jgi:hypothetical protein
MAIVTIVDPQLPAWSAPTWKISPIWDMDLPQLVRGRPSDYIAKILPRDFVKRRVEPVSANSGGIFEATEGRFFAIGTREARFSSFNAGEALFPGSRWSVLPCLVLAGVFAALVRREVAQTRPGAY